MAVTVRCRFCRENAINHDHDKCAENFWQKVKEGIVRHCLDNPDKLLPEEIKREIGTKRWQWYLEYKNRQRLRELREEKMKALREKIQLEVGKILSENTERIESLIKESGLNIYHQINMEVFLTEEGQY